MCKTLCSAAASAETSSTLALVSPIPHLPVSSQSAGRLAAPLSVARPHVPASLITQGSDSLIERGRFMNIFQPWMRRQESGGGAVPKGMAHTRVDINIANLHYQWHCVQGQQHCNSCCTTRILSVQLNLYTCCGAPQVLWLWFSVNESAGTHKERAQSLPS